MAHLKKGADGHLLKNAAGHLVKACVGGAENTCNDCDPPIPDTLYVTFSGLAGDFAQYNGKHTISWIDTPCHWGTSLDEFPSIWLTWFVERPYWTVTIQIKVGGDCYKIWDGGNQTCTPTDPYAEQSCEDIACDDSDTCEDSAGATCVVSTS